MKTARVLIFGALLLGALCTGCAGVLQFSLPDEFKDMKVIEDPAGTWLDPKLAPPVRLGPEAGPWSC